MSPYPWMTIHEDGTVAFNAEGCTGAEIDRRLVIVQEVHAGRVRVVDGAEKVLRREGWRARLVAVESLMAEALGDVRGLIDGDVGGDGLVNLSRDDFDRVESWWNVADAEGYFDDATDAALLDRLRREVGA